MIRPLLEPLTRRRLFLAFALYFLPVLLFVALTQAISGPPLPADVVLLEWIHNFASPMLDRWALLVTTVGGPEVITLVSLAGVAVLHLLRRRRAAVVLAVGVGGAALINTLLKLAFHRVRPELWTPLVVERSFSFPSGHAMVSSALACSVTYILWHTRWRWLAVGLGLAVVVAIGLSRLYLGVHYPTDVLAGWTVGFFWVVIVRAVLLMSARWW